VAKFNPFNHQFMWAQRAGGTGFEKATALAINGASIYVAGYFGGSTADFGTTTLSNAGANTGGYDVFVAKLTDVGSTGSFTWAQQAGGNGLDYANALAVSGNNVYVAGSFDSPTVSFGLTTLTKIGTITTADDVFVTKLIDAGSTCSFAWVQQAGGLDDDQVRTLAVSGTSVYVAGAFSSPTAGFGLTNLTSAGFYDVFVAKLIDAGSTGNFAWAQRAGGMGYKATYALAVSSTSVYVAGYFGNSTSNFGTTVLSSPNANPLGYLATLTDATLATTAASYALAPAQLFPNPAHHTATLRLPIGTTPAPLVLTDVQGRTVRQYRAQVGSEAVLDLQGVPAGLYLLRGAGPVQRLAVE
jgi:hypothetical protein